MTEDIEPQISEVGSYRGAEVLKISKLCKLAHAENKLAEFIEQNLTPEQVKEKLLVVASTQNEIGSTIYHKEMQAESPVITVAKAKSTNK